MDFSEVVMSDSAEKNSCRICRMDWDAVSLVERRAAVKSLKAAVSAVMSGDGGGPLDEAGLVMLEWVGVLIVPVGVAGLVSEMTGGSDTDGSVCAGSGDGVRRVSGVATSDRTGVPTGDADTVGGPIIGMGYSTLRRRRIAGGSAAHAVLARVGRSKGSADGVCVATWTAVEGECVTETAGSCAAVVVVGCDNCPVAVGVGPCWLCCIAVAGDGRDGEEAADMW